MNVRSMSRRSLLRLMGIGALGAVAASCTPAAPGSPAASDAGASAPAVADVLLRHMAWGAPQIPAIEQQAELFKESAPNISIEIELVPWAQYWDKLWTALAGGGAPDTFWLNMANFAALAHRDTLLNIQPYLDAQPELQTAWDGNFDPLQEAYSYNGEAFAWPRDYDTIAVALNLTMLEEAGLAYPSEEDDFRAWDWATIRSYAEQLTREEGGRTSQFGIIASSSEQQGWFNWVISNDGRYFTDDLQHCLLNEPEAVEALTEYTAFRRDGLSPGAETLQAQEWTDMFLTGRVGMAISGSWNMSIFAERISDFDWDIVPIPYAPTGKSICMIHGLGDTIDKNTSNPDASFEWVSFLGSPEGSAVLGATGTVIPSRRDTAELWFDPSFPPDHRDIYLTWTDRSEFRVNTAEPATSEWLRVLTDEIMLIMEQDKDVQLAMDDAVEMIDELLAGREV